MFGESHEGRAVCILLGNPLVRRTFLHVDDSAELFDLFSGVAASRDSNCGVVEPQLFYTSDKRDQIDQIDHELEFMKDLHSTDPTQEVGARSYKLSVRVRPIRKHELDNT